MGSTFNTDKAVSNEAQAQFLAKAKATLDGSLACLPPGIEARLDSVRLVAMEQARAPGSGYAADSGAAAALDSGEAPLPESVRQRLDAIRAAAMQRASAAQRQGNDATKASSRWWMRWAGGSFAVPASAFASICVLVTTLAIFNLPAPSETMPLAVAENSLVLASAEELELYDNLEFYQWLVDNGW